MHQRGCCSIESRRLTCAPRTELFATWNSTRQSATRRAASCETEQLTGASTGTAFVTPWLIMASTEEWSRLDRSVFWVRHAPPDLLSGPSAVVCHRKELLPVLDIGGLEPVELLQVRVAGSPRTDHRCPPLVLHPLQFDNALFVIAYLALQVRIRGKGFHEARIDSERIVLHLVKGCGHHAEQ